MKYNTGNMSRDFLSPTDGRGPVGESAYWTFLTNHSHVLVCLAAEPNLTMREVAAKVGITERAVQRIIAQLVDAGALTRAREGRRNQYKANPGVPLRHPVEAHCTVGDLLATVLKKA
jgi:DNA-binding transcriptional ArsR family regulator